MATRYLAELPPQKGVNHIDFTQKYIPQHNTNSAPNNYFPIYLLQLLGKSKNSSSQVMSAISFMNRQTNLIRISCGPKYFYFYCH